MAQKERQAIVDSFQTNRSDKVLILSLKAAGTGLNLTAATAIIHYDLWWNPAVENQATDRAYRIGQKSSVNVYRFISAETFEEKINTMIESKKALAEMTVETGENWIGDRTAGNLYAADALILNLQSGMFPVGKLTGFISVIPHRQTVACT